VRYVDGYLFTVQKKNLAAFRRVGRRAGRVWRDHGALEFRACVGEDLDVKMCVPFPHVLKLKRGETAVLSWIVFESRAHRDRVIAKVMKDRRMTKIRNSKMPFDVKRLVYGGFDAFLEV